MTGASVRGDRLLVATGRRPRVNGIGLETVGMVPDARGIPVDAHLRAGACLWAIGDVTGIWPLTHVGKYQGRIVAANILGEPREANYDAVPRVAYTDPHAAAVGAIEGAFSATVRLADVAKTATYTHAYAESDGYLTLLSDGERLTGAYALGPEAGEWLQQATLAIRARVPLDVLLDTIQPFPTFSEIYLAGAEGAAQRDRHGGARRGGGVMSAHRVVIVGGGFGGLQAALGLRRAGVEITLIDRRNFHLFQPLSYQVATGALSPGEVAYPLRAVFKRNRNVRVLLAEVARFDLERREVRPPVGRRPAGTGAGAL